MGNLGDAMVQFNAGISAMAEAFMNALAAATLGVAAVEDAALEYQHARMMAGAIYPLRRPDDPKPYLAAIRLPEAQPIEGE